jgi:hypothetical protein
MFNFDRAAQRQVASSARRFTIEWEKCNESQPMFNSISRFVAVCLDLIGIRRR